MKNLKNKTSIPLLAAVMLAIAAATAPSAFAADKILTDQERLEAQAAVAALTPPAIVWTPELDAECRTMLDTEYARLDAMKTTRINTSKLRGYHHGYMVAMK
jgi:hypothetical protein